MNTNSHHDENRILADEELELVQGGAGLLDGLKSVIKTAEEIAHLVSGGFQV